jgi:hypothetical protein
MRNSSVGCFEGAQIPGTAVQLTSERNLEPPIIGIEKIDEPPSKNSNRSSAA